MKDPNRTFNNENLPPKDDDGICSSCPPYYVNEDCREQMVNCLYNQPRKYFEEPCVTTPRKEGQTDTEYRDVLLGSSKKLEGIKADDGKLNLEILMCHFAGALEKVAEAPNYGAWKYSEGVEEKNWSKVKNPLSRYRKAFLRHTFSWLKGEDKDKESGVKHIYSMVWNLLVLIEFQIMKDNDK